MQRVLTSMLLALMALAILTSVEQKNVRVIEAHAVNDEYMVDSIGSEWYIGDNAGDNVLLVFDTQGTATQTDDILLEVRTAQ